MELEKLLGEKLKDQKWRLNNLYWIKNNEGEEIKFRLNWAQNILFDRLWYLNIILKARQLGITTFFCILFLDNVLFKGLDAGLIAHTLGDAIKIFDSKIKYAWDHLPDVIKNGYGINTENVRELKFVNKATNTPSSIYVGTSLRSGTVQRLHISELGTLDQKFPGKAEEIRTGALNTIHKGQIVTIESTAKGPAGVFYELCNEAMDHDKMRKTLTEMDYKPFFFPWWKHPSYSLPGDIVIPKEYHDYFDKLEVETEHDFTPAQRNWYYKKSITQGESMKSEFPSTPDEAFMANIEGAYFGKQMDKVMDQGRICNVPWEPTIPVDTWWDLGTTKQRKDATSIVFTQTVGLEIRVIDFYGGSGEGFSHYKKILDDKQYSYGTHNGPHDLEVTELGTGKTRLEVAGKLGILFRIVPRLSFADGIEASRIVLAKCWFDEERTHSLIKALLAFRKLWDDRLGKFQDKPLKDWASDPADAFRYMAVGHTDHRRLGYYDEEELMVSREREWQRNKVLNPFNPFADI